MAKLGKTFDSGQHDDMQSGFDPIPIGVYLAMVAESEIKTTKKKDGKYISLKFKILEGKYKGRFIWTNLNIINPNPVAVEIAQNELATLCRACGKVVIQDTQELHGIPIKMKIKITPAKGDHPAKNSPIGYMPATAGAGSGNPAKPDKDTDPDEDTDPGTDQDEGTDPDDTNVPWGD